MTFKEYLVKMLSKKAKKDKKRILFIDGGDIRAINAAKIHQEEGYLEPIILVQSDKDKPQGINSIIVIDQTKISGILHYPPCNMIGYRKNTA